LSISLPQPLQPSPASTDATLNKEEGIVLSFHVNRTAQSLA
jgi:hypothetical protein